MDFMKALLGETNVKFTENGAKGLVTTGKHLLDANFAISSFRHMSEDEIINRFYLAFHEQPDYAMKWLFFVRDIREGIGERRTFRVIFKRLACEIPDQIEHLCGVVAEYGRWDDLVELLGTPLEWKVFQIIKEQLEEDIVNMHDEKPISLLAKWIPSANASSKESRKRSLRIMKGCGLTSERDWRKTLTPLRQYLDIVERKMTAGEWGEIDYSKVPSKAGLNYRTAFYRHDAERYEEYIGKVTSGEAKINASTLFPHDVVSKYRTRQEDAALEAMWQNLPDFTEGYDNSNTLVVRDGSGSMQCRIGNGNSSLQADHVATALSIYFAEKAKGPFHDSFITFSRTPRIIKFPKATNGSSLSLFDKLRICYREGEIANTDIVATMQLILNAAKNSNMTQDQMPDNILIISDMEFDRGADANKTLFEEIIEEYEEAGYKVPRLVFWNVNSRSNTIPLAQNELGVALVSGFSPAITKMIFSGELDPYKCLLDTILVDRYEDIYLKPASI